jgi:uncharacterized protein
MNRKKVFITAFISIWLTVLLPFTCLAQDFPEKPYPPRLVNDFAHMFSAREVNALEQKLVAFNDSSTTQIAVVTIKSLNGYAISDYAPRLAEKWGIGQKGKNNGVLVLIKPQTANEKGEVFIATGYGLEGIIPDLTASEIVDNEILPAFRNGDYYGGVDKATNTLMALARREFTPDQYHERHASSGKGKPGIFFIILIVFLIIIFSKRGGGRGGNRRITSRSDLPFWLLMSMMGSGRSRGGWGGSSGGGFGGGGGGFGGFGGGGFGGGGAGGSW